MAATLKRLNYFNGRLLRAEDAKLEQASIWDALRYAGGAASSGVVYGFELSLEAETGIVSATPGLAVDAAGTVLLSSEKVTASVAAIAKSAGKTPQYHALLIAPIATRAGTAPACVAPNDRNPAAHFSYEEARVALAFERLTLDPAHLLGREPSQLERRSALASSLFAQERAQAASGPPLLTPLGLGSRSPVSKPGLVVGVLCCADGKAVFVDGWALRREALEAPARAFWAPRTHARTEALFWAEVLQFQTQLVASDATGPLRDRGFVELPSAGYVNVDVHQPLLAQLERTFEGVSSIRVFHAELDDIARRFEEARHFDRLSLRRGQRRDLDVFVPRVSGESSDEGFNYDAHVSGRGMLELLAILHPGAAPQAGSGTKHLEIPLYGSLRARTEGDARGVVLGLGGTGGELGHMVESLVVTGRKEANEAARAVHPANQGFFQRLVDGVKSLAAGVQSRIQLELATTSHSSVSLFAELGCGNDPLSLEQGASTRVRASLVLALQGGLVGYFLEVKFFGTLVVEEVLGEGRRRVSLSGRLEEQQGDHVQRRDLETQRFELRDSGDVYEVVFDSGDALTVSARNEGAVLLVRRAGKESTVADLADRRAQGRGANESEIAARALAAIGRLVPEGQSFSQQAPALLFGGRTDEANNPFPALPWVLFRTRVPEARSTRDFSVDVPLSRFATDPSGKTEILEPNPVGAATPRAEPAPPPTPTDRNPLANIEHRVRVFAEGRDPIDLELPRDASTLERLRSAYQFVTAETVAHPDFLERVGEFVRAQLAGISSAVKSNPSVTVPHLAFTTISMKRPVP